MQYKKTFLKHFVRPALILCGVAVLLFSYSLHAQGKPALSEKTLFVFPEKINSQDWKNIAGLYTQDSDTHALYQNFSRGDSAYLETRQESGEVMNTVRGESPTEVVPVVNVAANGDSETDVTYPAEATTSVKSSSQDVHESVPGAIPVESAPEAMPVEAVTEKFPETFVPEDIAPETPPSDAPVVRTSVIGTTFARLTERVALLFGESTTVSEDAAYTTTTSHAAEIQSLAVPVADVSDELIMEDDNSHSAVVSTDTGGAGEQQAAVIDAVLELSGGEPTTTEVVRTPTAERSVTESGTATPTVPRHFCEGEVGCGQRAITFDGFDIPALGSGESIQDVQLRLSLAAKPRKDMLPHTGGLLIEYSIDNSWHEAGSIALNEEVSNAINGGYFLYALPEIDTTDVLKTMQIRVTYYGDPQTLENIFIDSVWMQLGVLTLTEEELRARVAPDALTNLEKPADHEMLSNTVDFTEQQLPTFALKYQQQRNFIIRFFRGLFAKRIADVSSVSFIHHDFGDVGVVPEIHATDDGLWSISVPESDRRKMRPGTYEVEIQVSEGGVQFDDSFEFQWGLLAVNTNKSQYEKGEIAQLSFAALSDNGNTICDAILQAYIVQPDGFIKRVPVATSGVCHGNNVVDTPDYFASYETNMSGRHTMYVERLQGDGTVITHTEDIFEVVDSAPVSIERSAPTRIYPVSPYLMELAVSAHQAFSGTLIEYVPYDYEVSSTTARISIEGDRKLLVWDIAIKQGETQTFSYSFDSPDISPYLYLLGPARIELAAGESFEPTIISTTTPLSDAVADDVIPTQDAPVVESMPTAESASTSGAVAPSAAAPVESVVGTPPLSEDSSGAIQAEATMPVADSAPNPAPQSTDIVLPDAVPEIVRDAELLFQSSFVETLPETDVSATTSAVPRGVAIDVFDETDAALTELNTLATPSVVSGERATFTEKRSWQVASDATGSMIVYWTDGASIPSGWTCLSCTATGTFYQKFVRGSTTYSGTASYGASTTAHTASGVVYASSATATESGGSADISAVSHTHTLSPTIEATSTLPAYRQLRVIQSNSAGEPSLIPAGAILLFDDTLPSGWATYTSQNGYFARGENTVSATGGGNTHRHGISGTTAAAAGSTLQSRAGSPQSSGAIAGHTHTVTTLTGLVNNEPPYREVIFATSSSATSTPVGALTFWTDTPPTAWVNKSAASGDPFFENFLKASTTYGTTGGVSSHTHTDVTSITSSAANAPRSGRSGSSGSSASHTHLADVSTFSTDTHLPPYVDVIVAKRLAAVATYTQLSFRWFANTNAEPPTDQWPVGAVNLDENEPITATSTPVPFGTVVRLRVSIANTVATATAATFKLQFASTTGTCASISTWVDVGGSTSTVSWRGYDNAAIADGATLSSSTLANIQRRETYEEVNPTSAMPNDIAPGENGEWDFVVQHNAPYAGAKYCFRMVKSDGTELYAYTQYPSLYTNTAPTVALTKLFDNEKVATTTPTFTFTGSDTESDELDYQLQVDDDYAFTSTSVDLNSESSALFENTISPADKSPFTNGETISLHPTTALTNGTTYYWRVRSKDQGSTAWGSWATVRSFTVDTTATVSTWFQTRTEQFDTDTLVGINTASNQMSLKVGSTTGTSTSQAIRFSYGTAGNAWGALSWVDNETTGNVKYFVQYEVSEGTWALIPDGDLAGNSAGFGTSPVSLLSLNVDTYASLRVLALLTNSGGSPTVADWTLSWGYRIDTPTTIALFGNEKTATTTPTFSFYTTDPQGDDLTYEIQWSTSYAFTASTTRISSSSAGFANITNATDTSPFYSGNTIHFTVQAADALTNNTTYWWRVRAIDPTGSNTFSFFTDPQSFTVDTTVTVSTWFETVGEQFDHDVLSGVVSSGGINATVATTADESVIVYGDGSSAVPKYREWDGATWSSQASLSNVGVVPTWVVTKSAPTREESISATMGGDADVNVQVFSGGSWGNAIEVTATAADTDMRAFDVVYETVSGKAMVVYCDGDADPSFYMWNGTSWTSGGTIDLASTNNCGWIRLISDPTSNEIIVISRDITGSQYEAQVWNGTTWGNSTILGSMSEPTHEGISAAYEESGDQAVIVVSNGNFNRFTWTAWSGSAWTTAATQAIGNDFEWGKLAVDAGTDTMTLCYVDESLAIGAIRWTGSAWTGQTDLDTTGTTKDSRPVDCAYETVGARDGYVTVAYSNASGVRYRTWNGGTWSAAAAVSTLGVSPVVQMRRTGDGKLNVMGLNSANDRYDYSYWDGSVWSTLQTLGTDASVNAAPYKEPFMMSARAPGSSGSIRGSPSAIFTSGSGPYWQQLSWNDTEAGGSTLLYQMEYYVATSGSWALIPNALIPGNSTGTTTSPINLTNVLPVSTYGTIRPVGNMTCSVGTCPVLADWTLTWAAGITVSGTAKQFDQSTNVTSGTVAVALNGVLQTGKTGTIAAGVWSIANVNAAVGDVITVFITGTSDATEAVGITRYDGTGNATGIDLFERHLSLGSDDLTTITNTHIGLYDFTNSEDLFADVVGGTALTVCATTGCADAELIIKAGTTYQPGSGATVTTNGFENNGTFLPNGNTIRVSGSWDNNATATMATSTLIFTATSTSETIDDTGASPVPTYNNITFGETSGTATWTMSTSFDIAGTLATNYGTLARGALPITISGSLSNGSSGVWTGVGTTTFYGASASTWTDSAVTKQNIGNVVNDGTSKTVTLGSNVRAQSLTIGADDIVDAGVPGYDITVLRNWTNGNVFTARAGSVIFAATTTNAQIAQGASSFYNLTFAGGGGSWSFTGANLSVTNNFTVSTGTVTLPTGTTTVAGSWDSTGGLFAHNNSGVVFSGSAAKTITLAGTNFTNTFYNLTFSGSGSWSFVSANATTSNNLLITQGTVTLPSGVMALGGNLSRTGGSFTGNNGVLQLTAATAKTLQTGGSSFANLLFTGSGSWSFIDSSITATGDITISSGAATLPTGTFTIGGSFTNAATFVHSSGTVLFNSTTTGRTINPGNSSFYAVTLNSAAGGWTVAGNATTTGAFSITNASTFTLTSGLSLAVGGTFTNSVGGASTTWAGSTLSLTSNTAYAINTKSDNGDVYGTMLLTGTTSPNMWNSSGAVYSLGTLASLYSQDHTGVDGDLYIFGAYSRTSGTEYWSYATDFDGTALGGSSRQANVRFASGATATFSTSTLSIVGTSTASTTIASQSGTYTLSVSGGTTTASYYAFSNLGLSGVTLGTSTVVTALSDGSFTPAVAGGSGLTIASSTIDTNPALQIFRVTFATTSAISAYNVTQSPGVPASYWWFRTSSGNLGGEAYDNDTGDPGSIRWDDSSLLITASGTVYADEAATPLGAPTCDGSTSVVRVVVNGGTSYTGACNSSTGAYSIPNIAISGSPILTVYLDTNGGVNATTITKTPTQNITDLNLYANRIITRHEDVGDPLTIADMATYDETYDTDIRFDAATGTTNTLTVRPDTELHIASSTTFVPGGSMTLQSGGSGNTYDGTFHIDNGATFTGAGTTTYNIGGRFAMDLGATFTAASSTVVMTATTTNKTITTVSPQVITFNNLQFTGVGGGWPITADIIVDGAMSVSTGTVSGTGNMTINYGSLLGNGTVAMTSGTTTIARTNTFGGTTPWSFYNLTLGNGSVAGTTTPAGTATTTVSKLLTIATAHVLSAGASQWNLAGTSTPFVVLGTFNSDSSTVRYSASTTANIVSTSYYNLDLDASAGTAVYTATGSGVNVLGNLTVGGQNTTSVTFDTNDPALAVAGSVTIAANGTLVGSNSGLFTVGGSWSNAGTFTSSNGSLSFIGSGSKTIAPGTSSFGTAIVNGAGSFTMTQNATATSAFTITAATAFTVNPGVTLAVGGSFTNSLGGVGTTWTGSVLSLYSGTNYQINASTTNDVYGTLLVGANTHIRMWNSSAATTTVTSSGSLYSQDHAGVDGALSVYGAYTKTSGTDYWSYATDFDGTTLGSPRAVTVSFAPNATATIAGGSLQIVGGASATTSITNQGSGTYALIVNAGTLTAQYYKIRNINSSGLVLTNVPTISELSYGDFAVEQNGATALTVGSTVITQNAAKSFTGNVFATTTGVSSAFNVTATGTTASTWRFVNHTGAIAGEAFDVDPGGDPGYVVWEDSAGSITISGHIYSDEGSTPIGAPTCDGSTKNVRIVVHRFTSTTTSCAAGDGLYTFSNVLYSPGDEVLVYLDTGGGARAANVTVDPVSSINTMDLYQNRVIVRHEDSNPITITDLTWWSSADDADVPFTALSGSPDTLTLSSDTKLVVWNAKSFAPGGNVTLAGGGAGGAHDGTLELYANAAFTAAGTQSHSIGGSLIVGSGAVVTPAQSTFTFTTTGASRTIDTNDGSFYNLTFNGAGSWVSSDTNLLVSNTLTITTGAVTLPVGTTTVSGSFVNTGGSFAHASGTLYFNASSGGKSVRLNGSSMNRTIFNGAGGAWAFVDTNATTSSSLRISAGTVTFPSGVYTVGSSFNASGGTFVHNSGTVKLTGTTTATTLIASSSSFASLTIDSASGGYTMGDSSVTLLGSLTVTQGALTLATGTLSVGGSFTTTGGTFNHASGTVLFNATATGKTIAPGNSPFYNISLASPTGGWTISGNATSTGNFSLTSASQFTQASGTTLSVSGVFTNTVGGATTTWAGSTLRIESGMNYTINTSGAGGDQYQTLIVGMATNTDIRMWNSAATTTTVGSSSSLYSQDNAGVDGALYIYGDYGRTSGSDYWSYATDFDGTSLGGSSRQVAVSFAPNATATYTGASLGVVGTAAATTTLTNQGSGTYALILDASTLNAQYYAVRNSNAAGLQLRGLTTVASLSYGDFELAVSGGSLITLSSTTLNANASLTVTGLRFATTTAITGTNVELVGTTASAWTFSSHTDNLSGESYDIDGGTDCGSLRWSDSTCLITEQTHYRWRNDDGGESVPDSEWFDLSWSKRKRVTLSNSDATTYTNAVVKVPVTFDADMQSDFDDLRFTDASGTTTIPYWIETYTGSVTATVWVKVPSLAAVAKTSVYMYYGNGGVSDASSGSTTFSTFDDYEDGNVTEYSDDTSLFTTDTSNVYERTKRLIASDVNGRTTNGMLNKTTATTSQGQTIRYFQYIDTAGAAASDESCTLFGVQAAARQNYAVCQELFGVDHVSLAKDVYDRDNNTGTTVLASTTVTYVTGWHEVEIRWGTDNSINVVVYRNGSVVATTSATDSTYTTGGIGYTFWSQHGAWDIYTVRPLLDTEPTVGYGVEQVAGGATWFADLDTLGTGITPDTTKRLRFAIENSGLDITNQSFRLDYAEKGVAPSCESVSSSYFAPVPPQASCGTSPLCMKSSTYYSDHASTTDLLEGDGTFTYGQIVEDPSNKTNSMGVPASTYTEVEYALSPTSYATSSSYCFRVSNDGIALDSYAKVPELALQFDPTILSWSLNNGEDIVLNPGATTTIYATGTVSDVNGYADMVYATATIYRSGVGASCSADNNNCYQVSSSSCALSSCSGNSCAVSCRADIYFFADPTDSGAYSAQDWRADILVSDQIGGTDTQSTFGSELLTLRALEVDSSIAYGALAVTQNTGSNDATTTVRNIGNDAIDVSLSGTDLSDGVSSAIPVSEQRYATSTFTYSSCVFCSTLSTTSTAYEVDLSKPTTTTPVLSDDIYWGIAIPFGASAQPHSGVNTFMAISD